MRSLILWNLVSIQGCFDGAKPWDLDWHLNVWGAELEQISLEQLQAADLLLFGRCTYEGMAAHWQTAEGEIAEWMNRIPKVVFSRTLESASWSNTRLVSEDAATAVARLKREGDGPMFVFGSGNLCAGLIRTGLFDEYRLLIAPVVLANARPLFPDDAPRQNLRLLETRATAAGGVLVRYAPQRTLGDAVDS